MRSSDHIGFVLSVKKPNCETYSVCGVSFPLQKESINIIALFLKYEQLPACLALAFFMHRLPLRPPAWRDLRIFLVFRSSLGHRKQISKSLQSTYTRLPSLSVDLGKFPKCNQSPLCSSVPSKSAQISGQQNSSLHTCSPSKSCGKYTNELGVQRWVLFVCFLAMLCSIWDLSSPQPEIEPMPPALEEPNLNHWTAKEVPRGLDFNLGLATI